MPTEWHGAANELSRGSEAALDKIRITTMSIVLLVDDDRDNLWALQLALESSGHHAVLAQNGREALRTLLHVVPRLIVTDWQMPEMDGAELCRRIRCQPALAEMPIVMLSSMPAPPAGPVCWSAFFRKPADLAVLMHTVNIFISERLASASSPGPGR
jgi:CheY-like chemotaxis protein